MGIDSNEYGMKSREMMIILSITHDIHFFLLFFDHFISNIKNKIYLTFDEIYWGEIYQYSKHEFYELLDPTRMIFIFEISSQKEIYWDKNHDISKIRTISKRNKNIKMKYKQNLFITHNSSTIESDVSFLWSHFFHDRKKISITFFMGKFPTITQNFAYTKCFSTNISIIKKMRSQKWNIRTDCWGILFYK